MQTTVGYIRVSTLEQASDGLSLDTQREMIEKYCSSRGMELVEVIVDAGVSGGLAMASRPGGKKLLEHSATNVVATRLDRLFRDTLDCLNAVGVLNSKNRHLHLLDLAIDTTTPMGKFFLTILASFATLERQMISSRIQEVMDRKKRRKERAGTIPFGFRVAEDGVTLLEDPEEQITLKVILGLKELGLSYQKITDYLNESEHKPRKSAWHKTTIHRICMKEREAQSTPAILEEGKENQES